ncbi:hypothetical protein M3610_14510 [Neobacillus sp. MER 74]|uniref:hypothetical protein n=1 Tax=Neobacillus sp. MER 74 TaxID=2939566 RepID=UPI002040CC7E|nr:hypothetical protein [Neobacillus sp. MER 74]MCM3116512.1 hypothetical protein [Neobacillus sp. MER 74]
MAQDPNQPNLRQVHLIQIMYEIKFDVGSLTVIEPFNDDADDTLSSILGLDNN